MNEAAMLASSQIVLIHSREKKNSYPLILQYDIGYDAGTIGRRRNRNWRDVRRNNVRIENDHRRQGQMKQRQND